MTQLPSSLSYFFFFSSRRRHTRCLSDWSSDVCSSDLRPNVPPRLVCYHERKRELDDQAIEMWRCAQIALCAWVVQACSLNRSEERRVGKECRSRCWL